MFEWFTWVQVALALVTAVAVLLRGLAKKQPNDYTLGAAALMTLLLVVQVVLAILDQLFGAGPTGDALEFWMYLITALPIIAVAGVYTLIDRTHLSLIVLSIVAFSIAVMVWRMQVIWTTVPVVE